MFPYCSGIFANGTEVQKMIVARIAEAELYVLFLARSFELFVLDQCSIRRLSG